MSPDIALSLSYWIALYRFALCIDCLTASKRRRNSSVPEKVPRTFGLVDASQYNTHGCQNAIANFYSTP